MRAYISGMNSVISCKAPDFKTSARYALLGRCPCCGQGKLFRAYLKQVDACSVCGERFADIRADDGAPWLTIILVGHIFLPLTLAFVAVTTLPSWGSALVCCAVLVALSLAILPRAKALFIAILWHTGAPGSKAV
jgi:uncharacterized protein (DUF983 family)